MRIYIYILLLFTFIGYGSSKSYSQSSSTEKSITHLPYLTVQKGSLFPGDGSLLRAEDGVVLKDGRIIVVDQAHGHRLIEKDGSNRSFGDFVAAGFLHLPPKQAAGPNGVFLEHDGEHILMADVADGKIYRTNIATEEVEIIYDHPFGVNSVYRDRTGAIWFSQSAESTNLGEMFQAANLAVPTAAVFRMADLKSAPVKIMDSLYFANGITMDADEKQLFIAETMMDRVHKIEIDIKTSEANYIGVAAHVGSPDNIIIDNEGRLIIASPLYNQVVAIDFKHHSQHIIFDGATKDNLKKTNEWHKRSRLGMERLVSCQCYCVG